MWCSKGICACGIPDKGTTCLPGDDRHPIRSLSIWLAKPWRLQHWRDLYIDQIIILYNIIRSIQWVWGRHDWCIYVAHACDPWPQLHAISCKIPSYYTSLVAIYIFQFRKLDCLRNWIHACWTMKALTEFWCCTVYCQWFSAGEALGRWGKRT